jgi:hypothetical protein
MTTIATLFYASSGHTFFISNYCSSKDSPENWKDLLFSNVKEPYGDVAHIHFGSLDLEIVSQWQRWNTQPDFEDRHASFELDDLD